MANRTQQPEWRFRKSTPGDPFVDPTHDEFFTTQDVGGLNNALVRETIQNSLDAKDPGISGPIYVRFSFNTLDDYSEISPYLKGLIPHLIACKNGILPAEKLKTNIRYLTIEDYGTIGLEGDPEEYRLNTDVAANNNFFYFWRNVGRSGKKEGDRGRWGLGKAVFPVVSRIRSFFGLTIRKSDQQMYFMGHSLLKNHQLNNGADYKPFGYYAIYNHDVHRDLPLPLKRSEKVNIFSTQFKIPREKEPGLSIVIPYLREEITFAKISVAILKEFFYPILDNDLVVIIEDSDERYTINEDTINEKVSEIFNEVEDLEIDVDQYRNLLDFTKWILEEHSEEQIINVKEQDLTGAPRWSEELFDEVSLKEIKSKLDAGDRLTFKVPTKVHRTDEAPQPAEFQIYIERDDDLKRSEDHFIREGLRLPGISSLRQRGMRGMVVVDQEPLVTMLGDAENPAHTEWQKDARGFKEKYHHAPSCLYFVTNSLKYLPTLILASDTETDPTLLEDFFSLPITEESDNNGDAGSDGISTGKKEEKDIEINSKPKPVRIQTLENGFALRPTGKDPEIHTLTIKIAYDIARGNPFTNYSHEDFDLRDSRFKITHSGFEKIAKRENELICTINNNDFTLKVEGFDPNRDVVIKLDWTGKEK